MKDWQAAVSEAGREVENDRIAEIERTHPDVTRPAVLEPGNACGHGRAYRAGVNVAGSQRYRCPDCGRIITINAAAHPTEAEIFRLRQAATNDTGQLVPSRVALYLKALAWRELPAGVDRAAVEKALKEWML